MDLDKVRLFIKTLEDRLKEVGARIEVKPRGFEIHITIFDKDDKRDDYALFTEHRVENGIMVEKLNFIRFYNGV